MFETKDFEKKEVEWQQYQLCIDVAEHLDQGPTRRAEATELYVGHQDGSSVEQFTAKSDCIRPLRHYLMGVFGPRATIFPSRGSIDTCKGFFPAYDSRSTSFLPNVTSSAVCYFRAPSVAILTSLRPAVNPLHGCSSGKPVQDQLA